MAGFYAPYLFIPPRAIDLGVSPADAASLLSVVGLSNTIGRVFYGWFADLQLVSALRLSNFSIIGCGILNILFLVCTNYYTMVAYGLAFGFIIAGIMSLTSIVLCDLVGLSRLTNAYGLLCLFRGIAFIFGSPLAGIVYDWTASYNMTFVYSAVLFLLSGGMTLFIEVLLKYKPDTCLANQPALQPLLASPAAGMANAYNANNRKLTAVRENEEDYQEEDEDDLDDDEEGGYGPGGARSVSMSKLPPLFEEHSHYGHGREHAHKEPEGGVLEALIEEEDSQLTEQSNSVLGKRFRLLAEGGQSIHSQQKSEIEPLKKIMERMDAEKPANPTE